MPTNEEYKPYFVVATEDLKLLSDYSGMAFSELLQLDCFTFKLLFKDAYIYSLKKTKEGREYLEDCWLLKQTTPDRKALRNKFQGGGDK